MVYIILYIYIYKYIDVLLTIMLFISNIDHCPIVDPEVAICSDIGGHGSGVYIMPSPVATKRSRVQVKNLQLSSTLVRLGGLPCKRGLPSRWLGLHRKGRMAAHMQNGLTHWNKSCHNASN